MSEFTFTTLKPRGRAPIGDGFDKKFRHYLKVGRVLGRDTPVDIEPYKTPLLPIENGYGYHGVLTMNKEHTHLQCGYCGYFYRSLGKHLSSVHGISSDGYREEMGLARRTPLTSPVTTENMRATALNAPRALKEKRLRIFKSFRGKKGGRQPYQSLETKNKRGRCPDQLIDKIRGLAKELGRAPTKRQFIDRYGNADWYSAYRTFNGWNNAIKVAGFEPHMSGSANPTYTEESVLELIQTFLEVEGRPFRASDMGQGIIPSKNVIHRLFGGVQNARDAAGQSQYDYISEVA